MKTAIYRYTIILGTLLSFFVMQTNAAPSQIDGDHTSQRAVELIRLINSGDRKIAEEYVNNNYSPAFLKMPMEAHLNFISTVHDQTRGIESYQIQKSSPISATILLQSKLTHDWMAISIHTELKSPYRIEMIGSANISKELKTSKKLNNAEIATEIEKYLQTLSEADLFSGTVLLAQNGKVFYKGAFGAADKNFNAKNKIDTNFNLGSMDKMFTAIVVAQLVAAGKLSFDDPLSKFLPDFPNKEDAKKIKIKHLLTHTSGLGNYFNQKFMDSSRARFRTVDDMMTLAEDEKSIAFEPGTKWQYSNTGFLVLGKIIELVTHKNYYDVVRENIYRPADMNNSDSYDLDSVNDNLAVGYDKVFTEKGMYYKNNLFKHVIKGGPAGGGYSTVEDLLKFDIALQSNKFLSEPYTQLVLSAKPDLNSPNYGYGFEINHDSNTVGHSGGFTGISSNLAMYLNNGYTVIVLSNYSNASTLVMNKIFELLPTK